MGGGRRQKRKSVNSSVSSAASLESNVAGDLRRPSAAASKMGPVVIGRRQNMKSENSLVESTCMAPQFCSGPSTLSWLETIGEVRGRHAAITTTLSATHPGLERAPASALRGRSRRPSLMDLIITVTLFAADGKQQLCSAMVKLNGKDPLTKVTTPG